MCLFSVLESWILTPYKDIISGNLYEKKDRENAGNKKVGPEGTSICLNDFKKIVGDRNSAITNGGKYGEANSKIDISTLAPISKSSTTI